MIILEKNLNPYPNLALNGNILNNSIVRTYFALLFSFIFLISSKLGYEYNDNLGYFLFSCLSILLVLTLKFPQKILVFFLCSTMLFMQGIFHFTTHTVISPDAQNYYNYIDYSGGFSQFIDMFWSDLSTNLLSISIYNSFGIIYLPIYYLLNTRDPYLIVGMNTLFTVLIIYMFSRIIIAYFKDEVNKKGLTLFLTLSFLSPSLIYWSSTFLKDITILLICTLSIYLLLKKRYILFLFILVFSYTIRPYSFVPILCYYLIIKRLKKTAILGAIGSFLIVLYKSGFLGAINSFITLGFTVLSPNPFSLANWINETYRTIESAFMIWVVLVIFFVFFTIKKTRTFFVTCFASIYIYNCVLTLISYVQLNYLSSDYGIAAGADDLSRKKLMLVIMFYLMFSYAISAIIEKRKHKYKKTIKL